MPRRTCDWCARSLTFNCFAGGNRCKHCCEGLAVASEHGITVRKGEGARACTVCGEVKRYSMRNGKRSQFPMNATETVGYHRYCRTCFRANLRKYDSLPQRVAQRRRYEQTRQAKFAADPKFRERRREQLRRGRRRHYQKLRNDPKRWAQILADGRIDAHLRAERAGRTVVRISPSANGYVRPTGSSESLPEAPLRSWLEAVILCKGDDVDLGVLACDLGVYERQLNGIRRAEYPRRNLGLADTMLTRYDRGVNVPGYGWVWRVEDLWPVELGEESVAA